MGAGLTIEEALKAVAEQCEKAHLRSLVATVRSKVVEGYSLADSLGAFPHVFDQLFRSMVAAGEMVCPWPHRIPATQVTSAVGNALNRATTVAPKQPDRQRGRREYPEMAGRRSVRTRARMGGRAQRALSEKGGRTGCPRPRSSRTGLFPAIS